MFSAGCQKRLTFLKALWKSVQLLHSPTYVQAN